MLRSFIVQGVNPGGIVVQLEVVEKTEIDARKAAETAGMKFCVVVTTRDLIEVKAQPAPPTAS
jgi:ribosomal protein L16/L10AE